MLERGGDLDVHGHPPDPEEVKEERVFSQIKEDVVARGTYRSTPRKLGTKLAISLL